MLYMKKQKIQKTLTIITIVGVLIYFTGWSIAKYTQTHNIVVGANIGAGILGLLGLGTACLTLIGFIFVTLFMREHSK